LGGEPAPGGGAARGDGSFFFSEWMDGWKNGRMDGSKDGRTDGWTDGQTEGRMDRQMDGQTDRRMDGRTDGWSDRGTERQRNYSGVGWVTYWFLRVHPLHVSWRTFSPLS
jgi:hypothetical protein